MAKPKPVKKVGMKKKVKVVAKKKAAPAKRAPATTADGKSRYKRRLKEKLLACTRNHLNLQTDAFKEIPSADRQKLIAEGVNQFLAEWEKMMKPTATSSTTAAPAKKKKKKLRPKAVK